MWKFNEHLFESYDTWKPGLNVKSIISSNSLRQSELYSELYSKWAHFNENNYSK